MSDNSGTGAFFAGLLLGGVAGVAAALLFTPQSGEEVRVQLQTTGAHLKSEVSDKASSLQARGKVLVEERATRRGSEGTDAPPETEEIGEGSSDESASAASNA